MHNHTQFQLMRKPWIMLALSACFLPSYAHAQNSMVGDGFGGRSWYRPTNYTVGSYSAFSLCYSDPCDTASNQLYGWGTDLEGELGNGAGFAPSNVPVAIPGMSNVRYYTTGYYMGAIKNDNTGWVWAEPFFPNPTLMVSDASFVDAGAVHCSFVKSNGTVWSVGLNPNGQFGDGTYTPSLTPVQMAGVNSAVRVACSYQATFVLLSNGKVLSVGDNTNGLLGYLSADPNATVVDTVQGLSDIVDIKAHSAAAAALTANGEVYCWGYGAYCGDGDAEADTIPVLVSGLENIIAISGCTDGGHFLALDAYGRCYTWGSMFWMSAADALTPALVATDVIDIMAGETFSYVVKADGTLWAAGSSNGGSIWLNLTDEPRTEFTQLEPSLVPEACPLVGTVAVPSAACDGSGGIVSVGQFGGSTPYSYDLGFGAQSDPVFTGLSAGNYTVTVTDAQGCVTTASCTVDPTDVAPVSVVENVTTCTDEGYLLPWGITVYESGSYSDTIYNALGCDTVRTVQLSSSFPNWVSLELNGCVGQPFTLPSGRVVYESGYYEDTLSVAGACDTLLAISLNLSIQGAEASILVAPDSILSAGGQAYLFAIGGSNYAWTPTTGLSCSSCPDPVANPMDTTEYCVVVTNDSECPADTACIKLYVPPLCTADDIYIPNAFSPPTDRSTASNKNDSQCVFGAECIATMNFSIYDRWGRQVFVATDPTTCWDGIYNGQPLDAAVFAYHLSATLTNGETVEKSGNITLVR